MNAISDEKAVQIENAIMEMSLVEPWEKFFPDGECRLEHLEQVVRELEKRTGASADEIEEVGSKSKFFPPADAIAIFKDSGGRADEAVDQENDNKEANSMKGIKPFNIFLKSNSYVNNSPKMGDDSRKIHSIILPLIWDEVVYGAEQVSRVGIHDKVAAVGIKVTRSNFTNYFTQVKMALDFFGGSEEARKDTKKKKNEGSKFALLLRKLYDDGFRTLPGLYSVPDIEPVAAVEEAKPVRQTRKPARKKVGRGRGNRGVEVQPQAPPAPVASAMVNGNLAAAIAHINAQIAKLEQQRITLVAADSIAKEVLRGAKS